MEKMEELKNRLEENSKSIHIARVPKKTKQDFVDLANEEFESDYGMTLKFLMEGLVNRDIQELVLMIEEMNQRIINLEQRPVKEEVVVKGKKMLDGSIKGIGGK